MLFCFGDIDPGRPFLLVRVVGVSRLVWIFFGDGVLVISPCGLLLVEGFASCGISVWSSWISWCCGSGTSCGGSLRG